MFRDLLSRESRFPPLLGTGLAAVLMGAVAVASAQASLPSREERAARMVPAVAPSLPAARPHIDQPKFAFASPLSGFAVNSPFGLRKMPWEEGGRLHEGVDIAAPAGTPVRVTLAGTVLRTGVDGGYGRFVEVAHGNGLTSLYAHLGRTAPGLKAGMVLPAGYVVAWVGSSGRSTGAHLHFEIRQDGRPLDPAAFMVDTDQQRTRAGAPDLADQVGDLGRTLEIATEQDHPADQRMGETLAIGGRERQTGDIEHHGTGFHHHAAALPGKGVSGDRVSMTTKATALSTSSDRETWATRPRSRR